MKKTIRTKRGFTLIEIAVAMTVFMIFIGIILSSFIHLLGVQVEANRYRKVYSELNDIIALISTDVREFGIDYSCFETAVCDPNIHNYNVIAFVSKDGLERRIIKIEDRERVDTEETVYDLAYTVQKRALRKNQWPATIYRTLETKNTEFTEFRFDLNPLKDPYDEATRVDGASLFQPSIMINAIARIKARPDRPGIPMQTTISSRQYNVRNF